MVVTFMQNSAFYSLLLLVFIHVGCSSNDPDHPIKSYIDAEILNLSDSTVHLYSAQNPFQKLIGVPPEIHLEIKVDSNGIFSHSHEFPDGYYTFQYDEHNFDLFVQKGHRLGVKCDAKTPFNPPSFSGPLKYEADYLWTKFLTVSHFEASLVKNISATPSNYAAKLIHFKHQLDSALITCIANHPNGSKKFIQQESLHNIYAMAKYILWHQSHLNKQNFRDSIIDSLAQQYPANINDSNAFDLGVYYDYIEMITESHYNAPKDTAELSNYLKWITSNFTRATPRDYLLAKLTQPVSKWKYTYDKSKALDTILQTITDENTRNILTHIITKDTTPQPDSNLTNAQ